MRFQLLLRLLHHNLLADLLLINLALLLLNSFFGRMIEQVDTYHFVYLIDSETVERVNCEEEQTTHNRTPQKQGNQVDQLYHELVWLTNVEEALICMEKAD